MFVSVFLFSSSAESNLELTRKLDTLHVFPGNVQNENWKNTDAISEQNIDEDGIYQSFNKSNSAYLDTSLNQNTETPSTDSVESQSESNEDVTNTEGTGNDSPSSEAETTPLENIDAVIQEEDNNASSAETQSQDVEVESVEEPITPPAEIETVSQNENSSGIFAFFERAVTLLPFVNETVVEPVIEAELSDTATEPVTSSPEFSPTEEASVVEEPTTEIIQEEEEEVLVPVVDSEVAPQADEVTVISYPITLSDFALPKLESGQFITNAQLRMSLGAQYEVQEGAPLPSLEIEYKTDGEWMNAGSVVMESEVSNALNGGYFLFALPLLPDVASLEKLQVRISYQGDTENLTGLYLDSVWLELATETYDRTLLEERLLPEQLPFLTLPSIHELISTELDFTRTEDPMFVLRYESQRNGFVQFFRSIFSSNLATIASVEFIRKDEGIIDVTPQIDMTADGLWTIQLSDADREKLQPGTYIVELTITEGGKTFSDTFDFQWGMLAINPNQTEYEIGDTATIAFGALSQNGNTLCDANLNLYIIDPLEFISRVPVSPSGLCNGNNVVDRPDYLAQFTPEATGTYEMYVERLDQNGIVLAHTSDTFVVKDTHNIFISRSGPTRIYPPSMYPMQLTVTSKTAFAGKLVERVPADFTVNETNAIITRAGDEFELTWNFELAPGSSQTFSYSFDAPDISPFLYNLGPAEITSGEAGIIINEVLPATPEVMLQESITTPIETVTDETVTEPTPETSIQAPEVVPEADTAEVVTPETPVVSTEETSTVEEPVVETSAPVEEVILDVETVETTDTTPLGEGSSTTETTTTDTPVNEVVPAPVIETAGTPTTPKAFTEHRRWQIASDAAGSMIVFWADGASIPGSWFCISCVSTSTFYNRFPKGGATYGTTGGVATTTHTASTTVNAVDTNIYPAVSESGGVTGADRVSHSHDSVTLAIGSTTTLPAYRSLRVIQHINSGIPSTTPAGAIFMFDTTLPSGWARYTPLDARYPMGQNAIVSSSTNTHIHSLIGTTSAAAGTPVRNRTAGGGNPLASPLPAIEAHTHTISSSTIPASSEPPYIEVIFASSSVATATPINAIAMWSDTPPAGWLNRSAQAGDPFYDRYIKGSATYGTTGGSETHTHDIMSATTSSSSASTNGRWNATRVGVPSTHKHIVDFSNFSTASNTPPSVTVIFAKYYGLVPVYNQFAYRFYANEDLLTPTDPWPAGVEENIDENTPIDPSLTPIKSGEVVRLRIQLNNSNSTSTGESFKLQFGTTSAVCTTVTSWTDVGGAASSTAWIGHDNGSVADGATLSSTTLTGSDIFGSYEEFNPSVTMPNAVGIAQDGEWDFVIKQNNAEPGANYCFRMVESDDTPLFTYTEYPLLVTNQAPDAPTLMKLFDNEKVGTTTPKFEFTGSDAEGNNLSYHIQIDDDRNFGSINIEKNSASTSDKALFSDVTNSSGKNPYAPGDTIRFSPTTVLTDGLTYYWRVQAIDPTAVTNGGSNTFGIWSEVRSFTIGTTTVLSTWFQTMEEQFDTGTHLNTDALTTDVVQLASGSTTGTTTSSAIDFTWGTVGNAWGSLAWSDTETATNTLRYRLQYYDDELSSWVFIPDTSLSGNSAGFGTSSISLLSVDVTTYRIIRILGIFAGGASNPKLSDWTVTWGYRIPTPTTNMPFPNEKVGTTTPTFEFTTTDPQNDDLVYEFQWSTTSAFTASTTRVSSTSAGFVNITNGGDTTPFTSGHTIQYKIQPADALVNLRTYWWRVRAIDPNGSQQYSFYTDAESITVDTTVTVSTWFQTTVDQFNTDALSGTLAVSTTSITVASTSLESLIAYAEGNITTPRYRVWDGTAWSAEANALDVYAPITWIVTRAAPREGEYILATMGTDADVNVQVYRNGEWENSSSSRKEIVTSIPNTAMRGFDVAYEQTSGDAMIVSCDGNADPIYYIWDGTTWTNGGGIGLTGGNTCGWVKLISDPASGSDEIIAVTRDTGGIAYEARVWNGSAWGNSAVWGSMQNTETNHEGIAAEYEYSGGQAIVAVSNGATTNNYSWRSWGGATWTAAATVAIGDDFEAGYIARDVGTDNMILCYIDQDRDIGVVRWNGGAWVGQAELYTTWDNTVATIYNDRPVDCAFEVGGARDGNIMVTYATTTAMAYQVWTGAAWSTAARVSTFGPSPRIQMRRTNDNLIQVASYASTTDRYDYAYWNSSTALWSTLQTLETDGASGVTPYKEPLMIAPKNPVITATVVGDPAIDFYAGSGPYWQQMSWTDTESGGSSILYQVEYFNGSSWELVPNLLIPGNDVGTTTSPINLTNVLPASTYRYLRPVANMTCGASCPVLSDWTLTWSAGITASGTVQQFNQSTNVSTGTVAVAVNGVLQVGKTGSVNAGTWSISNVNASPGDILTFFMSNASDTNEAAAIARYDGVGNMEGIKLFEQHVTLGSNDATTTPFTNADIGYYDYTQDEDLFFNGTGTALSLCVDVGCANAELYIMASSTFALTDTVNLPNIENNGTLNLGTYTMYVSRSWDNNATTTAGTSNVVFTATSTSETIDETGAFAPSFYNLSFGTTTGNATWTPATTLDVNGNLTVTRGTFARGTTSITVAGNLVNSTNGIWTGIGTTTFDGTGTSNWSDGNPTLQNVGRVVIDGGSKTVLLSGHVLAQSLLIGADDIFDVSATPFNITVMREWTDLNASPNNFDARAGTVYFAATSTNHTITAGGDNFYNMNFTGVGSWFFSEADLLISNDITIATGTVTMPTGTTTVTGSWNSAGGTFANNAATVLFNSGSAETITASGTPFENAFWNLRFSGSGSWVFNDSSATTSNDLTITQGTVTFPSNTLTVVGNFTNSGGSFNHNTGTVKFTSASTKVIDTNSSFYSMHFAGTGEQSFVDTNITALGNITLTSGTTTFPSGTTTIGGSFTNTATVTPNGGTLLFNATSSGKTISTGASSLYNVTFNSVTGGWTIIGNATTTNNFTLATSSLFTLGDGLILSVGGIFQNRVGGASTTWATTSILSLEAGNYSINSKYTGGDSYGVLQIKPNTNIQMWNSTSDTYAIQATSSLYSQDHNGADGYLYIFGNYVRTSGTEYWSSATDFDGASTSRPVNVRFDAGASATFATGTVLQIIGTSTATTSINKISTGYYGITASSATVNAQYYQFKGMNATGFNLTGSTTIASLANGDFEVSAASGTAMTVSSTTIDKNPALPIYRVNFSTTLSTSTPSDWLAGWSYRKSHTLTAAAGAGTNYQMKITLHYGAGTDSGTHVYLNSNAKTDFGDVRFTSSNGTTTIDYWVASSTSSTVAEVWVEIPADLSTTNQSIYVYYGNTGASYPYLASERAHGDATFLFFDDFTVDLSRWQREVITGVYPQISTTTSPTYVRNGGGITSGNYGFTSLGSNPTYNGFTNNAIGYKARNATDGIGSVAFRGSATTTVPQRGYQARVDQRAGQGQSFLRPPYSGWNFLGSCTVDTNRPTADVWYIYDVTASTSDFKIYRNGTLMKSCSDATYSSPGQISLQNHYGSYVDYDWVFVRKFKGTEPAHGSWGTEELIPLSSGTNVTAVGTSTSYWRFWEHTGALSGEAYDVDPGGNPGYIRWDDSTLLITLSGTVYSDDGVTTMGSSTCNGVTPNVTVIINPGTATSTWCASLNGAYSINVPVVGDVTLTTYLNTNGGQKGVVVTKTPTANITNHNIYANRVITKHQDVLPLTIADMARVDNSDDSDISFTAATGTTNTLVLPFNTELHIASSTTFAPGGNITINGNASGTSQDGSLHIDDNATFTGSATSTYTIGGSFTMDVGATFTSASTTVIMNATTSGKTITTTTGQEISFNNLQFTGANGGWNINGNIRAQGNIDVATGTVTGTGNITLPYGSFSGNGTVSLGSGTTTIEQTNTLGGTTAWTFGNLVLGNSVNVGTTTPATNATTTVLGKLTVSSAHYLNAGGSGWNLRGSGTVFVVNGTFLKGTSTVQYSGTLDASVLGTSYYNLNFDAFGGVPTYTATGLGIVVQNNLTIGSTNPTTVNFNTYNTALDVVGSVYIRPNGVLVGSNSGLFTVEGSWTNTGSFVHSNGKVIFDSTALGNVVSPGGSSFYDVDFNSASGGWTVGPSMRADRNLSILDAQSFVVATSTSSGGANWYDIGWSYRKKITIDHTKVASTSTSTLVNFPVLVNTTNTNFKYTGSGGNVGKSNGGDFLFTSSDGTTKLSHELEKYSSTTGELVAWVQVPVLATTTDTELYLYYGNSSASDQWNITGTWNDGGSNYFKGIYHMKEATGTNPADSSPSGNNGTHVNSPAQTAGQIDGSLLLNGTNQNIDTTYTQSNVTSYTVGAWLKTTDAGISKTIVQNRGGGAGMSLTLGIGQTGGGHGTAGQVGFEVDSNTIDIGISSVQTVHDGNWHYIVGTWSAATGTAVNPSQFKIYIDGALAATTSGSTGSATSPLTGLGGAKIGRHDLWATNLAGTVDEVRMATVVRSSDWIKTEYNNQSAPASFYTLGSEDTTGSVIEVRGTFNNAVLDSHTTWTGATLYINSGTTQTINVKSSGGDVYDTLRVGANTHVRMWNSSSGTTSPTTTGSVYSQDHAGTNGALYIYGGYTNTSGTDYWNYATDFDGTILTPGNERKVTVSFASSTNALYTGGGLSVIGDPTASTTLQNQGVGAYGLRIGGTASTTMNYYEVRNTNVSGIVFSGTPTVVSLSYGDFIVSQASGTAITVGGTALQTRNFTNNYFATSSGATPAFNVTATGTTLNSWKFTNHSGGLAGEGYDIDPGPSAGDPGYIVWDNSSTSLSVSGRVFTAEGTGTSTACDGSNDIKLVVGGVTQYVTSCNASTAVYTFTNVSFNLGDSFIVYIDGKAVKASTVSEDSVSTISNFDLYENRVIVRHEGVDPISIADMALWDSSDDPGDIPFTAVDGGSDTLTLPLNTKLIVWGDKTFRPGGNVTVSGGGAGAAYDGTVELYANAVFDATGSETHTIGGSLISGTGASIDDETSTFIFTTTGAARTIDTNEYALYNMTLNGSGSWTVTNSALDVPNDLTITQGALTLPTGTTTIGGSLSNTGGSFAQNGGHMRFTSSAAETIRTGGSNFGTTTFAGSGSWTYLDTNATSTGNFTILSGSVTSASGTLTLSKNFVNAGTFTHNSGTLRFIATTSSTTVRANGSDLSSTTFAGLSNFVFTDTNVALRGAISIQQGTVTLATGTMSIAGSFLNTGGAFNHASGTILFNSTDTGESINPGSSLFNIVSIAAPTGGYTITNSATTTGNFSLTSASSFTLASSTTLTVGGVFTNLVGGGNTTWSGSTLKINSGVPYTVNSASQGGDAYNLLIVSNNTDLRMWNSSATTTMGDSQSSLYSQDHGGVNGELNIYGNYERTTGTDYWSYATDFDGTSLTGIERAVNVRVASGATTTFSGGLLQMIGASNGTTTMTNQGVGTYSMNVTGGTLYALNYAMRNMDTNGLSLSGTTTITTISNGDYELAVSGGSLITVSSTTLNYNATQVISGMRFATTTAITGTNIKLTGTTGSAWTLTSHRGNLAGEAFDIDGGDACGSIQWDDSACLLTRQSAYRWRNDDGGEGVPDSEWYDTNWSKRKRVKITNSDVTTYTNAVIEIPVTWDSDMQNDFDDLRFTTQGGTTSIDFVREKYATSTSATVWVEVPSLAASADTEIYMYYGNGGATYAGNGTSTFAAYDDFEYASIATYYSGYTSLFTTSGSFAYQGSYGLKAVSPTDRTEFGGIYRPSATTSRGQTIRYFEYIDTGAGSGDEICTLFGVQNPGSSNQNYGVCLELLDTDRVSLVQDAIDNDTNVLTTVLSSTTISYTTGWYEVEVRWATTSIGVSVFKNDVLVATTSATDSSYTSGRIGFGFWFQSGGWDFYTARPLLATEPTTTTGFEQVRGGASWMAAKNVKASGVQTGTVVRPRFVIENTGFSVNDQYRLMYAPKGVSPSCESVGAGSYAAVPVQSSCGTSPICMQASSLTNQASTTDIIGGRGTFTYGQTIEENSNVTQSLTLGSNVYTEVEYAIAATINASSSNYCLKVNDDATSLDSYMRVAELELLFVPNITSVSLNGGNNIILLPGVTTTIYATGTVSDLNGYTDLDINRATTTIYRSGVTDACSRDNNNCYIASGPTQCSFNNCNMFTNSCDISCSADIYYFADPTDTFSPYDGETWRATLSISDMGGSIATGSAPSIDLTTMRAISVDNSISYPPLEVYGNSGSTNPTTTITNIGNIALDLSLEGTDLTDGISSYIPVTNQKFATSSFTYGGCGLACKQLSSTTPVSLEADLGKPTSTSTPIVDELFWGIQISYPASSREHRGTNMFTAVLD